MADATSVPGRFIYEHLDGVPTCHASTIAELPNGDLAAAWFGGERTWPLRPQNPPVPFLT